jgi:hypothetical protein
VSGASVMCESAEMIGYPYFGVVSGEVAVVADGVIVAVISDWLVSFRGVGWFFQCLSGIGLGAADESTGKLTGEFSVRIGFYSGDEGVAVPPGSLQKPSTVGW